VNSVASIDFIHEEGSRIMLISQKAALLMVACRQEKWEPKKSRYSGNNLLARDEVAEDPSSTLYQDTHTYTYICIILKKILVKIEALFVVDARHRLDISDFRNF